MVKGKNPEKFYLARQNLTINSIEIFKWSYSTKKKEEWTFVQYYRAISVISRLGYLFSIHIALSKNKIIYNETYLLNIRNK